MFCTAREYLKRYGGVLLPILTLASGVAHAGTPGSPLSLGGTGSPWLVAAGVVMFGCAALLLANVVGGAQLRRRVLCQRLEKLDLPAAISRADGKLEWCNKAMRTTFGDRQGDIVEILRGGFEVDAGQVYRLAIRAGDLGFAIEPMRRLATDDIAVLAVRTDERKCLVWTVIPPDRLPTTENIGDDGASRHAPFAQAQIDHDRNPTTTRRFHELFGDNPGLNTDLIDGDHPRDLDQAPLQRNGGASQPCNIYPVATVDSDAKHREGFANPADESTQTHGATATLDAVPVALMQFDFNGKVLWHNAAAREMLGHELHPGTQLADLVEPLGLPVPALIANAIASSKSRREMVRLRGNLTDTFLQISLTRVVLGTNPSLFAVLNDASELRLLEDKFAQSQKMEAVGNLAGGVAHDFNNVLTAIGGHSDLLLLGKDALHQDFSDLMQIRQNTHRAAALVRQLLAFSRKQTLNPTLISVQDVVSDSQYLLNRLIGEKVTLSLEHGRDLATVRADHLQFEQAIMNLVLNARDAMPNGGTITIATRNATLADPDATQGIDLPSGDYVEISVSDDGVGIDPNLIDQIFEPFFTTKEVGQGTGLGLSTVYGIVKQSGGYIFAENRAEGGARFRILLPRAYPEADDRIQVRNLPRNDRGDQTGTGAILLVEDEDPVRAFASRALRLRGYEVAEAASAEEAMEHLSDAANHVDLLVSDVVMPGMDGPTFAGLARTMRPGLRVVFISGYAEDSFRRNLVDHDFLFLPKPFSLTDLTAKVKEALDQSM